MLFAWQDYHQTKMYKTKLSFSLPPSVLEKKSLQNVVQLFVEVMSIKNALLTVKV